MVTNQAPELQEISEATTAVASSVDNLRGHSSSSSGGGGNGHNSSSGGGYGSQGGGLPAGTSQGFRLVLSQLHPKLTAALQM